MREGEFLEECLGNTTRHSENNKKSSLEKVLANDRRCKAAKATRLAKKCNQFWIIFKAF